MNFVTIKSTQWGGGGGGGGKYPVMERDALQYSE